MIMDVDYLSKTGHDTNRINLLTEKRIAFFITNDQNETLRNVIEVICLGTTFL